MIFESNKQVFYQWTKLILNNLLLLLILDKFLGTTKRGIGPTYASKMNRYGLRVGDLKNWDSFVAKYKYI